MDTPDLNTDQIKEWRSIVTLVVFVVTNVVVLFPFQVPIFVPRPVANATLDALAYLRVIQPRRTSAQDGFGDDALSGSRKSKAFVRLNFPMNFLTAPVIADLFLLAILAIGRKEVSDGTIGANHIHPFDIMLFFISLAYIAISIDASGLIRYLAFKVLQWGGKVGRRLFFYLYVFFFGLGSFIGNDPIILSGTAFLAYMTRVSSNIVHPRAWIYTQFAIANIASAILVSSNPTNLVLAGAFNIRFIDYTANMIVPVVITAIVLFPFLLYIVFADESLIPRTIKMHDLPEEARGKKPVNPNIPNARGDADESNALENNEQGQLLSLEEIMNPFLDKKSATVGALIMAATLITLLAINASHTTGGDEQPVFYVTLPAAFLMLCWDLGYGWLHRKETRDIARKGKQDIEDSRARRAEAEENRLVIDQEEVGSGAETTTIRADPQEARLGKAKSSEGSTPRELAGDSTDSSPEAADITRVPETPAVMVHTPPNTEVSEKDDAAMPEKLNSASTAIPLAAQQGVLVAPSNERVTDEKKTSKGRLPDSTPLSTDLEKLPDGSNTKSRATLDSLVRDGHAWCRETFPTTMAVLAHLPLALVPFAFAMFVLVQALVSSGWVPVFGYGWARWVEKTGTIGAIGGMGFLSVILCNFSGTNIGTTILLCRVIQAWTEIARVGGTFITERAFWATVYSMAIGVNYGAFSTAFSASLAGMLWRDILARKHIHVRGVEFARINVPIISISMIVGCVVLIGEVWIMRRDDIAYVP